MNSIASAALMITAVAAILLLIFGVKLVLQPEDRKRGLLMIACGFVFLGNVLIWMI